jgi:hypothetical protein
MKDTLGTQIEAVNYDVEEIKKFRTVGFQFSRKFLLFNIKEGKE